MAFSLDKYKTYDTSKGFGSPAQWQDAFEERMNYKILNFEEKKKHDGLVGSLYDAKDAISLRDAYRKLMMAYHPDRNGDTEENKTISQHINDVYFEMKERKGWK